jgi:hypothetical protein
MPAECGITGLLGTGDVKAQDVKDLMLSFGELRLSLLASHLQRLRELHRITESAFETQRLSANERRAQAIALIRKEGAPQPSTGRQVAEMMHDMADETAYPRIQRHALFAMAYGAAEHELLALCDDCRKAFPDTVTTNDLQGRGFQKARTYLTKVAGLRLPSTTEWTDLLAYGILRNAVIHTRGHIPREQRAALLALSQRTSTFAVIGNPHDQVEPRAELVTRFCDTLDAVSSQIGAAWDARWR